MKIEVSDQIIVEAQCAIYNEGDKDVDGIGHNIVIENVVLRMTLQKHVIVKMCFILRMLLLKKLIVI